jgi:hypothetical protein
MCMMGVAKNIPIALLIDEKRRGLRETKHKAECFLEEHIVTLVCIFMIVKLYPSGTGGE